MGTGIHKKYNVSEELADFMGSTKTVTRADVVKEIWAHAREHELKTTKKVKGRNSAAIKPDDYLRPILGSKIVSMGEIARAISEHLED